MANSEKEEYKEGGVTGKGWVKGKSGNPKGRPKGKTVSDLLREIFEENNDQVAEALAKKAIQHALSGDFRFWNAIIERVDGKVPDKIEGVDGAVLQFVINQADKPSESNGD